MPRNGQYNRRLTETVPIKSRAATMTVNSENSWIEALKNGDEAAAQQLFEEYFLRLAGLARKKLQGRPLGVSAPSDIVQSALNSFFQAARRNAFPRLNDREDLWRLLVVFTARKASRVLRDQLRLKRGGGKVRRESAFEGMHSDFNGIDQVFDDELTPDLAAILEEELECRLEMLGDESLQSVVRMKLEGYTNDEIARELECVPRTVERKLKVIRKIWIAEGAW